MTRHTRLIVVPRGHWEPHLYRSNLLEQYDHIEVGATFIIDPALRQLPDRGRYSLCVWHSIYPGRRWRDAQSWRIRYYTGGILGKGGLRFPGLAAVDIRLQVEVEQ